MSIPIYSDVEVNGTALLSNRTQRVYTYTAHLTSTATTPIFTNYDSPFKYTMSFHKESYNNYAKLSVDPYFSSDLTKLYVHQIIISYIHFGTSYTVTRNSIVLDPHSDSTMSYPLSDSVVIPMSTEPGPISMNDSSYDIDVTIHYSLVDDTTYSALSTGIAIALKDNDVQLGATNQYKVQLNTPIAPDKTADTIVTLEPSQTNLTMRLEVTTTEMIWNTYKISCRTDAVEELYIYDIFIYGWKDNRVYSTDTINNIIVSQGKSDSQSKKITNDCDSYILVFKVASNNSVNISANKLCINAPQTYLKNGYLKIDSVVAQVSSNSDARLKTNLTPYQANQSILTLPIYEYDYIHQGAHAIGCTAQDLQKICPQIVSEDRDGYLTIQESKIVYLLLDEMKKMRQELNELKQNK
jgi:hypothetical protein